jgi:hypothetical protein
VREPKRQSIWADVIPLLLHHSEFLGKWGVWLALAGFIILECLAHAFAAVIEHLVDPFLSLAKWHPSPGLAAAAIELLVPVAVFAIAVVLFARYLRQHVADQDQEPGSPTVFPHRGLIASMSLFNVPGARGTDFNGTVRDEIAAAVVPAAGSGPNHRDNVLRLLYQTTWGPLAAAVELHSERLRYVWLLRTKSVESDYSLVESWIGFLTGGHAKVAPVSIEDSNSVRETRLKVHAIYDTYVKLAGLRENQVIADMTSGTAAMTAGIILATLDEQRHVEYLSQGPKSLLEDGRPRRDLATAFQYVDTSPNDVAQAFVSFFESRTRHRSSD